MLVAIIYAGRDVSKDKEKRSLHCSTTGSRRTGYKEVAHYAIDDGNGGIVRAEALGDSANMRSGLTPARPRRAIRGAGSEVVPALLVRP